MVDLIVIQFLNDGFCRALIEERYAADLQKLSKKLLSVNKEQMGDMQDVWNKLLASTGEEAQAHQTLYTELLEKAEKPLRQRGDTDARIRQVETDLARLVKEYDDDVKKVRKSDGESKGGLGFFKKSRKNTNDDKVTPETQRALDGVKESFVLKARTLVERIQIMDEARISNLKDSVTAYGSTLIGINNLLAEIGDRIVAATLSVEVANEITQFCTKFASGFDGHQFLSDFSGTSTPAKTSVAGPPVLPAPVVDSEGFSIPQPSHSQWDDALHKADEVESPVDENAAPKLKIALTTKVIEDNPDVALQAMKSLAASLQSAPTVRRKTQPSTSEAGQTEPDVSADASKGLVNMVQSVTVANEPTPFGFAMAAQPLVNEPSEQLTDDDPFFGGAATTSPSSPTAAAAFNATPSEIPLNALVRETVNVMIRDGSIEKMLITGEIWLSIADGAPSVEAGRTVDVAIANRGMLERLVMNDVYAQVSATDPTNAMTIDLGALALGGGGAPVPIAKYQVHTPESDYELFAPLVVTTMWKCEESQTSVLIAFQYNSELQCKIPLHDVVVMVSVEGSGDTGGVLMKPNGAWNNERRMLVWNVGNIEPPNPFTASSSVAVSGNQGNVSPTSASSTLTEPQKLLARLETHSLASPGSVAVQFSSPGSLVSGIDLDILPGSHVSFGQVIKSVASGKYVAAKRTAFGAFGGKVAHLTASELGGIASTAAIKTLPEGTPVDSVIYGNVLQTSSDAAYLSRHIGLRAGLAIPTPALTINRLCGSGFQAVVNAAQDIITGDAEIVLAGGTENMSQSPYALRGVRSGTRYGVDLKLEDTLAHGLVDQYPVKTPMGITAENLGKQYGLTREDCDTFALQSQQRWAAANAAGAFKAEITPIQLKSKKGVEVFEVDEHPRPQTTVASLGKLPSVFIKDTGVVTAGNASGICDGAASLIVASEEAVKKYKLTPLAQVLSWNYVGVEPTIMGIGPVPAIKGALKRAGLSLKDMSIVEVNEAFAAQFLAVQKELGLDPAITNKNGGAIALGHPLGASGARIMAHMTHELHRTNGRYAVGSACIGGGQGIAVVIEKC
ncbi:hypothetical protein HDU76_011938 [Blyttiomyces sp. JEL0837]|nr:hypothetical protein HDU76_011938 [Blyttiomyces sp. JEL0837]